MNELQQFQPQVMAILGGLLQFLRGYAKFPEWGYHVVAVLLAGFGYVLFNQLDLSDWRAVIIRGLVGVSGLVASLYGGTFLASNSAKAGVAFIPVTNSKP